MKPQKLLKVFSIIVGMFLLTGTLPSQSDGASFYQGKTITLLNGWSVGSGPDIHGRLIARHLGRFIPGNPRFLMMSKPEATGTAAMNYLCTKVKPDGLTFGNATSGLLTRQLVKFEGVRFDFLKIPLLAADMPQGRYFYVRRDLGISSIEELLKHKKPIFTSWQSRGGGPEVMMELMFRMLGLERKPLYGFGGESEARLALLRGEADMSASNEMTYLTIGKQLEKSGQIRIILQSGRHKDGKFIRSDAMPHVPTFSEVYEKHRGKPPSGVEWDGFKALANLPTRNYWAPPGTPSDRIQALRSAFAKMSEDTEFQKESFKVLGYVDIMGYEGRMELIKNYLSLPKEIADLLTP